MKNYVILFDTAPSLKRMMKLETFKNYLVEYYIKSENNALICTIDICHVEKLVKLIRTHLPDEYIMVELGTYYTNSMYFKDAFISNDMAGLLVKTNHYLKTGEALQKDLSVDAILDKVSEHGEKSLTKKERDFLKNN